MTEGSTSSRFVKGVVWMLGGQATFQLIRAVFRILLASVLFPEDFGLMAMAMTVVSLSEIWLDLGFGPALVQHPDPSDTDWSSVFWLNLGLGLVVFAVVQAGAGVVGVVYEEPGVVPVLRALAFAFLILVPGSTFQARLQRSMDFRLLSLRRGVAALIAGLAALGLGLAGAGVWALVGYYLMFATFSVAMLAIACRWRPSAVFDWNAIRNLWAFGRNVTGARILNYMNKNLDKVVVGRGLGASQLGLYSLAFQGVLLPLQYAVRPVGQVLFSALSTVHREEKDRVEPVYLSVLSVIATTIWPAALLGVLAAPIAIPAVLGDKWAPVVPAFCAMAIAGMFAAIQNPGFQVLKAVGKPKALLVFQAISVPAMLVGVWLGIAHGVFGVAVGYSAVTILLTGVNLVVLSRYSGVRLSRALSVLARAAIPISASTAVYLGLGYVVRIDRDWLVTLLGIFAAGVIYVAVSYVVVPEAWAALHKARQLLLNRVNRPGEQSA